MYAYVINHFGNKIKYLEYELYFLVHFKQHINNDIDIVYLYSINDTPDDFIQCIKQLNLNIKFFPYDDRGITLDVSFGSHYLHFNTLRTCNYLFAYLLKDYEKICIVESDMFILKSIDDIFSLKTPSVRVYGYDYKNNVKAKDLNKKDYCQDTPVNGGVMVLTPSYKMFKKSLKVLKEIIEKSCKFPNEALLIGSNKKIYNLPVKYNFSRYMLTKYKQFKDIRLIHYDYNVYKPLDSAKESYHEIEKHEIKKKFLKLYKEDVYDVYKNKINEIISNVFPPIPN